MKREVRTFRGAQLRAKAGETSGVEGYAAVFNSVTDLGFFKERIKPGAFARALREQQDVRCLYNHDQNLVLGRTKNNTLAMSEDAQGLKFDCDFPDTQAARDLKTLLERGDVDGCSFGFTVRKQSWEQETREDGTVEEIRTIEDVDLFDVGPVTFPAYDATSCEARSLWPEGLPKELRDRRKAAMETRDPQDGDGSCGCDCPECQDGDCADCSDPDCDDPNCGMDRSAHKPAEQRAAKTKRVDGEDLPASAFLIVGDPEDTSTWKLPWKFSTDEKTKSHLRNALARFNQLKGVSDDEKAKAYKKLVKLCKKYGIDVTEEKSLAKHLTREQIEGFRDDMGGMEECSSALHRCMEQMSDHMDAMRSHLNRMDEGDEDDAEDAVRCMRDAFGAMGETCSAGHGACESYMSARNAPAPETPEEPAAPAEPAISEQEIAQARARALLAAIDAER